VFLPGPATRDAIVLRALLFAVRHGGAAWTPPGSPLSVPADARVPSAAYGASGYVVLGPRALRADAAERLAQRAFERAQSGRLEADAEMAALAEAPLDQAGALLSALGYAARSAGRYEWRRSKPRPSKAAS
jgi:hypothetical protein